MTDTPGRLSPGADSLPRPTNDQPECLFVVGTWLAMTAGVFFYVAWFGGQIPYVDDWAFVPVLSQASPCNVSWLWAQHNEHRFPIAKAIIAISYWIGGNDLRAPMFFQAAVIAAVALGLPLAVRRLRGRMSYADAFFPFLLLHWQHGENLIWVVQVFYFLTTVLFCLLLIFFAGYPWRRGGLTAGAAAVCLLALPFQGATGVAFTPALAVAMACLGIKFLRSPEVTAKRGGAALLVIAMAAFLAIGLYLVGYHGIDHPNARSTGLLDHLVATVDCARTSLGSLGGRGGLFAAGLVVGLSAMCLLWLWRTWRQRSQDRTRCLFLFLCLASAWTFPIVVGLGRAGQGGGASRYAILAAPILCCVYVIASACGPARLVQFIQMGLFTLLCAFSTYHMSLGIEFGKARRQAAAKMEQDIAAGIPLTGLAARHAAFWCWSEEPLKQGMALFQQAGIGMFAKIQPDPAMKSRTLTLTPSATFRMASADGLWSGRDRESSLVFSLDKPQFVYAVRLKFLMTDESPSGTAHFQILWPHDGNPSWEPFLSDEYVLRLANGPKVKTYTFWINQTIDRFVVRPDSVPFSLQLREISLLEKP